MKKAGLFIFICLLAAAFVFPVSAQEKSADEFYAEQY